MKNPVLYFRFLALLFVELCRGQSGEVPPLLIDGYTGEVSHAPGDVLNLHVSTTGSRFSVEIVRVGTTRVSVLKTNGIAGARHAIPENASSHGCHWPPSWSLPIPSNWRSGYYEVLLRTEDSGGKYVHRGRRTAEGTCFFVLRRGKEAPASPILLELSSNTYNAYNNWGGFCLYSFNARAGVQGHRVSFERPPGSQFYSWEHPFVQWAESAGYQLDFCANEDLATHPEVLDGVRLVLSIGHDEYWSSPMRDRLESFVSNGGNVAFFSGNTCCWQVRNEDNGKAQVCWKQWYNLDPHYPTGEHRLLSSLWSHHLVQRPENQLTGVGFLFGGYHKSHGQLMDGSGGYQVHRPGHWLLEGTSLKQHDEFGAKDTIVGYECDGCELRWAKGLPEPTGSDGTPTNFVVVATAPARWAPDDAFWYERFDQNRIGNAVLGTYTRGGTVVTCGSTDWSHGLRGEDPHVVRITRNVLDRLSRKP